MRPDAGWLGGWRPYALLVALCLVLYLPGLAAIPPLDRDEARFAQATRQMLETGDFLRIRFQNEARNKKPAGIYWLQALSVSAFSSPASTAIWPYRLPSLIGATMAALFVFGFGAALSRDAADPSAARRSAMIAAVLLASALGVIAEAHIGKTDAALLAAITAGQGALGLAYVRHRAGRPVAGWIAIAFWAAELAAILLKGPPGPALALATAVALSIADRDARWLRSLYPLAGISALAVVVIPWLVAIEQVSEGRFLADALGRDFATKLIGAQESHGAPPLSYLLLAFATFWPGSLLVVPALARAWRRHDAPVERFLLAWLVPAWIFLELVPTKLPHYTLPLYPALALLAAAALAEGIALPRAAWARRAALSVRVLWAAITIALAALLIGLPLRFEGHVGVAGGLLIGVGVLLLLGLAATLVLRRPGPIGTTGLVAALAAAFVVPAAIGVMPALDQLWLSRSAAELVAAHPAAAGAPLVAVGYGEPSLVFLLGTQLRVATPHAAAEVLRGGGEALVSSRDEAMFQQALNARGLHARQLGSVAGLDYSNGRRMVLTLYAVAPG
jgi:4-amino-4-deoxy-L-arabinose transferase-like glycosyltransferase